MKKNISLVLLLYLVVLSGCSNPQNEHFEGDFGTYEWIETIDLGKTKVMNEGYTRLLHVIQYTNTTKEALKPKDAIGNELILQHETDIELNDLVLDSIGLSPEDPEWGGTEYQLMSSNSDRSIKPGVSINVAMISWGIKTEALDSLYIRNKPKSPDEKIVYEKKIVLSDPEE